MNRTLQRAEGAGKLYEVHDAKGIVSLLGPRTLLNVYRLDQHEVDWAIEEYGKCEFTHRGRDLTVLPHQEKK